jgi:hypothetical protein
MRAPDKPGGGPTTILVPSGVGILSNTSEPAPPVAQRPGYRPPNTSGIDFLTQNQIRMSLTAAGFFGIGTTTPTKILEIDHDGDVEIGLKSTTAGKLWTIQSSSGQSQDPSKNATFQVIDRTLGKSRLTIDANGTVIVPVLQIQGGSDVAEPFEMATHDIPKGAVVSIDPRHPGKLTLSTRAYDKRVAGVLSGAKDIQPGIRLTSMDDKGDNVALSGRVYALADARTGPILPGDLLTTSNTPGYCMKVTDYARAQGAVIGKAMSVLRSGRGEVLVLVTHQ